MRTTIDRAGRVVVPKAIRERLHLVGGAQLDIVERGGVIEIIPVAAAVDIVDGPHGPVAVTSDPVPPLTDAELFAAIDEQRR